MGASIARGKRLAKREALLKNGDVCVEIIPIDGTCEDAAHSAVEELLIYAELAGIFRAEWPVYCGVDPGLVDLEEVRRRCDRLRQHLGDLPTNFIEQNPLLKRLAEWLANGEIFCVMR